MANLNDKVTEHVLVCHNVADKCLSQIQSCCSIGCAYCCVQPIEIVSGEELPIIDFVNNNMDDEVKRTIRVKVANWAEYFNENYDDTLEYGDANKAFLDQVDKDKVTCPFLLDNKCSIYPVRPLSCRAHIMTEEPRLCQKDGLREAPEAVKYIKYMILDELRKIPKATLRYLPVAMSRPLGLGKIFKPHKIPLLSNNSPAE